MNRHPLQRLFSALMIILCLILASCSDSVAPTYQGPDIRIINQPRHRNLVEEFQRCNYQLDDLDQGVPPIILTSLPRDLGDIPSSREKKKIFFKALLPMVLLANDEIYFERQQLKKIDQILKQQSRLTSVQLQSLANLAGRYEVPLDPQQPRQAVNKLLRRVDIVPVDLALAQAANESAWGTSRFSRQANNLFGEWTFIRGGGIVPAHRPSGQTHEVEKFATVFDSVRSYLLNLNTHSAYGSFRQLRAECRRTGREPHGLKLAEGLVRYSSRGLDYVRDLQAMISKNRLDRFASAKLRNRG